MVLSLGVKASLKGSMEVFFSWFCDGGGGNGARSGEKRVVEGR